MSIRDDELNEQIKEFIKAVEDAREKKLCNYVDLTRKHVRKLTEFMLLKKELIEYCMPLDDYQAVLFQIPGYREHFVHQFNVFLIGYLILNKLTDQQFEIFIDALNKDAPDKRDAKAVFQLWFLASMFHDTGYPLGKSNRWAGELLARMFDLERADELIRADVPNIAETLAVGLMKHGADEWLRILSGALQKRLGLEGEDAGKLDRNLLNQFFNLQSEDLIASLLVIAAGLKTNSSEWLFEEAAAAIALHECELWKGFGKVVTFRGNPFAFLLQYCDAGQEYGRPKSDVSTASAPDYCVENFEIQVDKKNVETIINYSKKPSSWEENVKELLEKIRENYFADKQLGFSISYFSMEDKREFDELHYKKRKSQTE